MGGKRASWLAKVLLIASEHDTIDLGLLKQEYGLGSWPGAIGSLKQRGHLEVLPEKRGRWKTYRITPAGRQWLMQKLSEWEWSKEVE